MAVHAETSPAEAADRLALRELLDAYAHCAGRRDAEGQKAPFTTGTRLAAHMSGPDTDPACVLQGRQALAPVFEALNQYQATTHSNGQSTVIPDGDRAAGESCTIAHHLLTAGGERTIMTASLRYLDTSPRPAARGCSPSATSSPTGARPGRRPRKTPTARPPTDTPAGSSCWLRSDISRETDTAASVW